ncbi:MAG: hypothetical protein ABIB93_00060 [Chloroflexota bacterium]
MRLYILYIMYGLGVLCISGAVALAIGYARYLSELEQLICLVLLAAMFGFLGKYLAERGR